MLIWILIKRAGIDEMLACEDLIRLGDFKEDLNKYLLGLKESPVRYLEELIKWNQDHAVSTHYILGLGINVVGS